MCDVTGLPYYQVFKKLGGSLVLNMRVSHFYLSKKLKVLYWTQVSGLCQAASWTPLTNPS